MRYLMRKIEIALMPPYRGRHRGTREQLNAQESNLRVRAYALAMEQRRAALIEHGERADWVMQ